MRRAKSVHFGVGPVLVRPAQRRNGAARPRTGARSASASGTGRFATDHFPGNDEGDHESRSQTSTASQPPATTAGQCRATGIARGRLIRRPRAASSSNHQCASDSKRKNVVGLAPGPAAGTVGIGRSRRSEHLGSAPGDTRHSATPGSDDHQREDATATYHSRIIPPHQDDKSAKVRRLTSD